jgi:two-component system, NarL family, sensor kinase
MAADHIGESRDIGTLLHGERRVLELIATGAPLASVLDELCRVIDERSKLMSAVFLLDDDRRHLRFAAGPHLPDAWHEIWRAGPLPLTAAPACGTAVTHREQVVVPDVSVDSRFAPYRDAARAARIQAAWSTPFYAKDQRVLGTFATYSPAAGPPSERDLELVAHATHLASIAVERHQTEASLRESERRFSTVFYANAAAMAITRTADSRFLYVNDKFVTLYGYSRAEVIGQTPLGLGLYVDPAQRQPLLAQVLGEHMASGAEARARTKSGEALDVLVWAERIQLQGEDCILAITCDNTDRKLAEEALRRSEGLLRLVLDALPVGVSVVDRSGNIILNNPASKRIWGRVIDSGRERHAESKAWWHATGKRLAPEDWASTRALTRGETSVNEVIDIEAFDGVRRTMQNSAVPIRDANDRITGAIFVNEDISERMTAQRQLDDSYQQMRALTGRLMRAQDDERRRIAQLLHETTAQNLAALKMLLARLNRSGLEFQGSDRDALTDSIALAEQSMTEVRTLSYLLYPPFLDEAGLSAALRWYAAGFAERSGIKVDLDLPKTLERLPLDTETALFRVVQEALINIHRHAGSQTARIRLRQDSETLVLEIEDHGHGIRDASLKLITTGGGLVGVGIAGMFERLQQFGGRLEITSGEHGTVVRAILPLMKVN